MNSNNNNYRYIYEIILKILLTSLSFNSCLFVSKKLLLNFLVSSHRDDYWCSFSNMMKRPCFQSLLFRLNLLFQPLSRFSSQTNILRQRRWNNSLFLFLRRYEKAFLVRSLDSEIPPSIYLPLLFIHYRVFSIFRLSTSTNYEEQLLTSSRGSSI